MDIAEIVFRVGVGVGALLIGIGLVALVLAIGPLSNDARSLANDVRRLTRLVEHELPRLLDRSRGGPPADGAPAAQIAPDRPVAPEPEPNLDWIAGSHAGRADGGPVQSADQREDEQIA